MTLRRNSLAAWPARAYREGIVHRRFLGRDCFLVNDPEAVRHVLTEAGARYGRPAAAQRLIRPLTGNGITSAEGDLWRAQRRMLSSHFTPRHLDTLLPAFAAAAERLVGELSGRPRVQLGTAFEHAAIDAGGRAMFGIPLADRAAHITAVLGAYLNGSAKAQLFDFLARKETDHAWAIRRRSVLGRRWFAEVDRLIARRRSLPPGPDLLSLLDAAGDADGVPAALIRDQVAGLGAAGFETTSQAMFWTAFLLAGAPAEQDRIRAELRENPPDSLRSTAGMAAWPRLRGALLEALRLYPPLSVVVRTPLSEDMLAGQQIPAGALIIVSPWVMHRHAQIWDSPGEFLPERFAGMTLAAALARPGFLPFSTGPRACLGAGMALAESMVILAYLLFHFRVALEPGMPVMPRAVVATRPNRQPWFLLEKA